MLTVIVPTFNEEDNIRRCLDSVSWADDVFVVDSFSTDRTVELAREYTPHLVQHEYVNSATQKNWAISQVKSESDWLMVLDADETVTPALREKVQSILRDGTDCNGFRIRRENLFLGELIRHSGWHNDYLVRLWRNGKGHYEDLAVHSDVIVEGRVGTIREALLHDSYPTLDGYTERLGRYSSWSASDLQKRGASAGWVNLTLRPLWRFFRMFVLQRGFLDGRRGLMISTFSAFGVFLKYSRLWDRKRRPSPRASS